MSEGWAWKCEFCGLFYSKRTAKRHDICWRIYMNDEFMRDQLPQLYGIPGRK